jgi:hypothetical protein
MSKKDIPSNKVLRYHIGTSQTTVKRHYLAWRNIQNPPMPMRCDNIECIFYTKPLNWNGKLLIPILDHKNGNNSDNHPKNLQLLCPNCDSQLITKGGGNRGRIIKSEGGFAIVRPDGKKDYTLPSETGHFSLSGGKANLRVSKNLNSNKNPKKE